MKDAKHTDTHKGGLQSYIIGFSLSLVLTLSSYFLVARQALSSQALLVAILVLAVTQFAVQLFFFLHIADESKPRWNLMAFWFMILVLSIVVFGSLWIMKNLDYHQEMTPQETDQYIMEDEGIKR